MNQYEEFGAKVYDEFVAHARSDFSLEDIEEEYADEAVTLTPSDEDKLAMLRAGIRRRDKQCQTTTVADPDLFDGEYDHKVLRLGDGRRVPRRISQTRHWDVVLGVSTANRKAVEQADDRLHAEYAVLFPFFTSPQTTYQQAVAACLKANDGEWPT